MRQLIQWIPNDLSAVHVKSYSQKVSGQQQDEPDFDSPDSLNMLVHDITAILDHTLDDPRAGEGEARDGQRISHCGANNRWWLAVRGPNRGLGQLPFR